MSRVHNSEDRCVDPRTWVVFIGWTGLFWGGTVIFATLFFFSLLDFPTSTKLSLYGTSIWLNGCFLPLILPHNTWRSRLCVYHECLVLWIISYTMTNVLWEIPWLLSSRFIFTDVHSLSDLIGQSEWMRSNPLHMGWWVLSSFGAVDLRAINGNSTFYALEWLALLNVAGAWMFYRLNASRSPHRYLIPIIFGGEVIAATLIFCLTEVIDGYANMPGGIADTLLALVWTQYQYIAFPFLIALASYQLLLDDIYTMWSQRSASLARTAKAYARRSSRNVTVTPKK